MNLQPSCCEATALSTALPAILDIMLFLICPKWLQLSNFINTRCLKLLPERQQVMVSHLKAVLINVVKCLIFRNHTDMVLAKHNKLQAAVVTHGAKSEWVI